MAKPKVKQLSLFPADELKLKTVYIDKPKLFDELFSGYQQMKAVSYAASPITVLSIFEKFGFDQMQLLVGENIGIKHYKGELQNKDLATLQKLMNLVRACRRIQSAGNHPFADVPHELIQVSA